MLVIDDLHELALGRGAAVARALPGRAATGAARGAGQRARTRSSGCIGCGWTGRLTEIRAADLRFSLDETRQLLDSSGVTLSDTGLALLHERTEGWAAGLRLAAISLARHPDPERFVTEFCGSERTVAGYLLAEVLERQPPEVRDLLLRTSVLERVSGPLADALTGRTGSEAILQSLEDANAFVTVARRRAVVVSLPPPAGRSASARAATDFPGAHRATAPRGGTVVRGARLRWSRRSGTGSRRAIGRTAARLLADDYVDLVFDGRKATLRALLAAFPADATGADAELALAFATGRLYDGLLDESAAHIAVAERLAATVPYDRRRNFDLRLSSARLWLACQRGDLDARAAGDASPSKRNAADAPARGNDYRASALMNFGIAELWSLHIR